MTWAILGLLGLIWVLIGIGEHNRGLRPAMGAAMLIVLGAAVALVCVRWVGPQQVILRPTVILTPGVPRGRPAHVHCQQKGAVYVCTTS